MVTASQKREAVSWARSAYRLSERRACRTLEISRSTVQYRSVRGRDEALRTRLKELAAARPAYGYRQLHTLLRREGWRVNAKRVYRLYREEGLILRRKRPKRRRSAARRSEKLVAERANEPWPMDLVHDTLSGGSRVRVLAVIDVHTRENAALVPSQRFRGEDVMSVLEGAGRVRYELPEVISVDNGTEFTSVALDHWAYKVRFDFSRPGKPTGQRVHQGV